MRLYLLLAIAVGTVWPYCEGYYQPDINNAQINIECETGTIDDAAYYIVQQKRQEAAITRLNELKINIPGEIIEITEDIGTEYNICPELIQALIWQESRCISTVYNSNCKGLMQVNTAVSFNANNIKELAAAKGMSYQSGIWDESVNIEAGVRLLAFLFQEYGDDPAEIIMRYNGDSTNLKRYLSGGEMSDYASEVLELSELLERAHGK